MADDGGINTSFLRRKLFGIPVLYVAGAAVLVLAVVAYRMQSNVEEDTETESDDAPENSVGATVGDGFSQDSQNYSGFVANPTPVYQSPSEVATTTTIDTNDAWLKRGVEWSVQNGLASAGNAQQALALYLDGAQLSSEQGTIRDRVVKQFGVPPEPITVGGTAPAPGQKQGNPPTKHTVKGPNDNTLGKLAQLYYGVNDDEKIDLLEVANRNRGLGTVGASKPLAIGTIVTIPKYTRPVYYISTKTTDTASEIARKNGVFTNTLYLLNDGMKFPVKPGTRVRVK